MSDTPTLTLYEKCKHGFLVAHKLWAPEDVEEWEEMGMYEVKCARPDCGLEIVRPGKTQCHLDPDCSLELRTPIIDCPGGRERTFQQGHIQCLSCGEKWSALKYGNDYDPTGHQCAPGEQPENRFERVWLEVTRAS